MSLDRKSMCYENTIKNSVLFNIRFQKIRYIGEIHWDRRRTSRATTSQSTGGQNPIITVTEHTPTPSPDYMKRQVFYVGTKVRMKFLLISIYYFFIK